MASIHKEMLLAARPEDVWAAIRDAGEVHRRLAPGFVVDCRLEVGGGARVVTFANGLVARELIVDIDDDSPPPGLGGGRGPPDAPQRLAAGVCRGGRAQPRRVDRRPAAARSRRPHGRHDGARHARHAADVGGSDRGGSGGMSNGKIVRLPRLPRRRRPVRRSRRQHAPLRVADRLVGARRYAISAGRLAPPVVPASGTSAGCWKAAPSRTCGWCRRAGARRQGDAAANTNSYGTTLRVYDPRIDAWQIQWTDPVTQSYLSMIGRGEGRRHRAAREEPRRQPDPLELLADHGGVVRLARRGVLDGGATWRLDVEFLARRT